MKALLCLLLLAVGPAAHGFNVASSVSVPSPLQSGAFHVCALLEDRTVNCWGNPQHGRLGDPGRSRGPVEVKGLRSVRSIATGDAHTCALLDDGAVKCWGRNDHGQAGDGTRRDRATPVAVRGIAGEVQSLAAGFSHSCALLRSGRVMCWGLAAGGRMGEGTLTGDVLKPVFVVGIHDARAIVSGDAHACAILEDSTVRCWGENFFHQLGDGKKTSAGFALPVEGLSGVTTLATGATHTCALLEGGAVRCWGYNGRGQMGDGTFVDRGTPSQVAHSMPLTSIGSGAAQACAISPEGALSCWGANGSMQLGIGPAPQQSTPVLVRFPHPSARSVVGGDFHMCAWLDDDSVRCWGDNSFGQLGTGMAGAPEAVPMVVTVPSLLAH